MGKCNWTVSEAQSWIKEHKKWIEDIESIVDETGKGWVADRVRNAPPNWMFYVSPPYAERRYLMNSWGIVKSVKLKKHVGELLWFCSDKVYGICVLCDPVMLTLENFPKYFEYHGMSEEERLRWFPTADVLYYYPIMFYVKLKEPLKYNKPKGLQVFMEGSPSFDKGKSLDQYHQVDFSISKDIDSANILDLLYNHSMLHEVWNKIQNDEKVLDIEGSELMAEDIVGYHDRISKLLVANGYAHDDASKIVYEEEEEEENKSEVK